MYELKLLNSNEEKSTWGYACKYFLFMSHLKTKYCIFLSFDAKELTTS